jgi:hypothetical protein
VLRDFTTQRDVTSADSYQTATIAGGQITIDWVSDVESTKVAE